MEEDSLERVEADKFALVIGSKDQEQNPRDEAEEIAKGAGNVLS